MHLNYLENTPHPQSLEKLSSMKLVMVSKRLGTDALDDNFILHPKFSHSKNVSQLCQMSSRVRMRGKIALK